MNVFEIFKNLLQSNDKKATPEGYCPNCWGRQAYADKFYGAIYQEKIDLSNINEKKGWIEAYAAEHLEGIKLQKDEKASYSCPSCKLAYHQQ